MSPTSDEIMNKMVRYISREECLPHTTMEAAVCMPHVVTACMTTTAESDKTVRIYSRERREEYGCVPRK